MKMYFRGWAREVMGHRHDVVPVTHDETGYTPGKTESPLSWTTWQQAFGKVDDLALNGSFLVEFNFEQEELRNWLQQFVISKPDAAIRLLAEMQAEAILALAKKTEERGAQNNS